MKTKAEEDNRRITIQRETIADKAAHASQGDTTQLFSTQYVEKLHNFVLLSSKLKSSMLRIMFFK